MEKTEGEKKMNFDEIYDRKGTHCVKYNAVKTAQRPQDALVMTLADMDLPCCPAIQQAIIERAEHPFYGYQQFDEELPEVVCAWAKAHSAALLDPRTIQITPSVNTAIALCLRAFTKPGDGILIQNPSYSPFRKVVTLNQRRCVMNELIQKEDHYELDMDDFEAKLQEVRLFILCSPHNPTSKVFTREELDAMLSLCRKYQVTVLADEIHADWVYGTMTAASAVDQNVITILSPSKTFNLQGMQCSFVFIPDANQAQALQHERDSLAYMNNQTFSHAAALAAYSPAGETWLQQAKAYVSQNAEIFKTMLKEADVPLMPMRLQSTFLLWVDCSGCCNNDAEVVDLFENRCHIYGSSGSHYQCEKPFIRLNIAAPRSVIEEAAQRLIHVLSKSDKQEA